MAETLRFLRKDSTVMVLEASGVTTFVADEEHIRLAPDALYAYPVATLAHLPPSARAWL